MAEKRIKDLSTTATSTATDDFLGIDGTTNGTRKLSARNPTFSGAVSAGSLSLTTALPLGSGGTGATTQAGAANAVLPSQTSNTGKYLKTDGNNVSWDTVGAAWGSITGTLSSQTDLQNALDAKTNTSIVPNTAPSAGQLLVGNAGGTAYAPVSTSGDVTIASTGATTIGAGKVTNAMLAGSIDLTTKVTGALPVANGGTGLTAGTSGGVLAFTASGTIASSSALAANALVVGGGAGVAPSTITTGTGVVTALGVNTDSAGAFVVNGGALGTPTSGTVTNLTGTASININGTVGATTRNTGAFTTLDANNNVNFDGGTFVFNDSGADKDFRVEGDTKANLLFTDASVDRVGVNQGSPASTLDIDGGFAQNVVAVSALDVDCSTGNYFTKTIAADSTFTFSNAPASRSFAFTLEITHTSNAITWPASVKWPKDTAPTLTTGKTHLFMFVTDDGGTRWRGAALVDYVN